MANAKYIAYYRVSTQKQGQSGLGLEAQQQAVLERVRRERAELVAEFKEVESGKRSDRPMLKKALNRCRGNRATLIIAKLDRLARDVHFISGLMKEQVEFEALDIPHANRLTIHLMAAMAEHEAEAISARTKAALAAAKARGVRLGGRRWELEKVAAKGGTASGRERSRRARQWATSLASELRAIEAGGAVTLRQIAEKLDESDARPPRGGKWSAAQVARLKKLIATPALP